ncbi:MAG: hypothetical protein ACYC3B_03200 [Sedimentisphaerales bacterium]
MQERQTAYQIGKDSCKGIISQHFKTGIVDMVVETVQKNDKTGKWIGIE